VIRSFVLIFVVILFATKSFSQSIAYANLNKILNKSNVGSEIIKFYSKKNEKLLQQFKTKEAEIREKEKLLISQKNILQNDEYTNKLNSLKEEINNFNISNKEQLLSLKNDQEKKTRLLMDDINVILKEYAEKNKIDIILQSNQILIGKSSMDITDDILNIVNEKIKKFKN
tara:strand:+ start:6631 stop:7143 length:513 start_codon:yes stop_codon:yes gene_type:complete